MTNTEKICQEIKRQMSLWWEKLPDADKDAATWTQDEVKALGEYMAYENLLDFIDSLPQEPPQGWISVKDRLPDNSDYVLTCSNTKGTPPFVRLHYYKDGKWLLNESAYPAPIEYWMPIPKFKEE